MSKKKNNKSSAQATQPVVTEPVAPTPVSTPAPQPVADNTTTKPVPAAAAAPKIKKPSICAEVKKLVFHHPDKDLSGISQLMIDGGWDKDDVAKRQATIATMRTDTLATIEILKTEGFWKQ